MNRAIIIFNNDDTIDIKSRHALVVADTYLYSLYGENYTSLFKQLNATDNKGVCYALFIEKGDR